MTSEERIDAVARFGFTTRWSTTYIISHSTWPLASLPAGCAGPWPRRPSCRA
jgi:hypothetical protein